jgi:hypothetical protein
MSVGFAIEEDSADRCLVIIDVHFAVFDVKHQPALLTPATSLQPLGNGLQFLSAFVFCKCLVYTYLM